MFVDKQCQTERSQYFDLIVLFCVACVLRTIYILAYGYWIGGDSPDYIDIAKNLAFNHAFAFTSYDGFSYTAFRPFLYPALIAVFWNENEPPITLILIIQVILGSLTVILTYLIARKHFSRFVSVFSALLLALSPMTLKFTAAVLTEVLFTFTLVAACYFWGNKKGVMSGVFFGLTFLTRPIVFPILLLLPLISLLPCFKHSRKLLFTITVFSMLVASPWIVRNSILFGQFTLTQSSGYGTNLLYGTIDTPVYGDDIWSWITKLPLTQNIEGLNEVEQDRRKLKIAVNRISENPVAWLKVRAKQYPKLFLDSGDSLLGSRSKPISQAIKEFDLTVFIIKLSSIFACVFLFLLFFVGFIGVIKNYLQLLHIYLLPIFFILIHLPMWIESRYLLPVMPFIYIIAVYGSTILKDKLKPFFTRHAEQVIGCETETAIFLKTLSVTPCLCGGGFAPCQRRRCAASCFYERQIFDKVVSVRLWTLI